jgi:hypothetical protein
MVLFALFTIGYVAGVLTALAIFPPRDREILEQEKDALGGILEARQKAEIELGHTQPEPNGASYASK